MTATPDASSNFIWPPTIYGAAFALAMAAAFLWPAPLAPTGVWRWTALMIGATVAVGGVAIALAAEFRFKRAGTAVLPTRPTTAFVSDGIYAYTRNPMYLGISLSLAGCAGVANSWWFLLALPFAMYAVTKLAIEREERYLEAKFGAVYLASKARVRRWL